MVGRLRRMRDENENGMLQYEAGQSPTRLSSQKAALWQGLWLTMQIRNRKGLSPWGYFWKLTWLTEGM